MRRSQLIITAVFLSLLLVIGFAPGAPISYGGVPGAGWAALVFFGLFVGVALVVIDTRQRRGRIMQAMARAEIESNPDKPQPVRVTPPMQDPTGPSYPHPIINIATCIGCHACVDACPHDVLAIVNGKATPIAVEQCMEDTSCQVECPTVPKSCIVVNSTKKIPERKVPKRNQKFMTNVPGIYLIGDVSGVPLIKNAINEGGAVVDYVVEDLKKVGANGRVDYDLAIIGIGPAGLSAAALARQRGLSYVAIEQDQVVATIQQTYQAGKYVYFNPTDQPVKGGIRLDGSGASKESMIASWMETVISNGLTINEYEVCKTVRADGDEFIVETEQDKLKRRMQYRVRRVILAIGNRGTPMRLNVPGEDLKVFVSSPEPVYPAACPGCGIPRVGEDKFCQQCGQKYAVQLRPPYEEDRVKYKLTDPNQYRGKHLIVVGAGNSAVEAAIDLAALRSEDGTRITGWRENTVSLVVRSNFKGDLKLGNKMLVYECIDEGRIQVYFGQAVKEITPNQVALMNAQERDPRNAAETARIRNDYLFALIGGEKPTRFLESIGIKIG